MEGSGRSNARVNVSKSKIIKEYPHFKIARNYYSITCCECFDNNNYFIGFYLIVKRQQVA